MGTRHRDIIDSSLHRFGVWSAEDPADTYGTDPDDGGVHPGLAWIQHDPYSPDLIVAIHIRNSANDGWTSLAELFSPPLVLDDEVGSFELSLTQAGAMITVTNAGAVTLTVPNEDDVDFPLGTSILIEQGGAGQVTVAPDTGVTVNSAGAKMKLSAQYAVASLVKKGPNTWTLFGNLAS